MTLFYLSLRSLLQTWKNWKERGTLTTNRTATDMNDVKDRIKRHEGCLLRPYEDTLKVLTVGYGRNLRDVPFTQEEVDLMFETDFSRALSGAQSFPAFGSLNDTRKGVLIEMVFQLGRSGVAGFKNFLWAAECGKWQDAHDEMLDSKWHDQTPERAEELADIFLRG